MPEWVEITKVDEDIHANRREKKKTEEEISILQNKLRNYEEEYNVLQSQKQFLGKEMYGDPSVRSALIEEGLKSSNFKVRQAASILRVQDTDVKWEKDVRDELINICVYIDGGIHPMKNWNIRGILYKIGKFGYIGINNSEE